MHYVFAVICWAIAIFLMITVGRKSHYHDSRNESYGQAVKRRVITSALFLLIFVFLLTGIALVTIAGR